MSNFPSRTEENGEQGQQYANLPRSSLLQGRQSIFWIGSNSPPHTSHAGVSLTIPEHTETTRVLPPVPLETFQRDRSRTNHNLSCVFVDEEKTPLSQPFQGTGAADHGLVAGYAGWSSQFQQPSMSIFPDFGIESPSFANSFDVLNNNNPNKRRRTDDQNHGDGGYEAGSSSAPNTELAWHDSNSIPQSVDNLIHLGSDWFPQAGQSSQDQNNLAGQNQRPISVKNNVYDSLHEQLSLPIDPHLRLFMDKNFGFDNGL